MTSRERKFEKIIFGKEKLYKYNDIKNFLEYHGFEAEKIGSSHLIFRRNPYPHITIVEHNKKVKSIYVNRMIKLLKNYKII